MATLLAGACALRARPRLSVLHPTPRGASLVTSLVFLACLAPSSYAEPSSVPIQARLLSPVASYSKVGAPFRARVIGAVDTTIPSPVPEGSILKGSVAATESVGLGIRHERASLELEFHSCELPDGEAFDCEAELLAVDNARENVTRNGRIQGILAAGHPHSWLGGVWYRPGAMISGRAASGLTGVGGKVQSIIAPSFIGAAVMVASRVILFSLPDAEIELPAGADLVVNVTVPGGAIDPPVSNTSSKLPLSTPMQSFLAGLPAGVELPGKTPADDIVNLAFFGTEDNLASAFKAAGWSPADPLTAKTFARSYAAAAAMRSYRTAPVSPLFYQGRLPDAVFQKTFNSLAKRHHIRLWKVDSPEGEIWLGAATHDVAIGLNWSRMSLTHRIDPNIDAERRIVVYDLEDAGCAESYQPVERPGWASDTEDGAPVTTDGSLFAARLGDCSGVESSVRPMKKPKRAFATIIARRFVLEGRHYLTRGNAYYWAYRGVRWTLSPKSTTNARVKRPATPAAPATDTIVKIVLNPDLPSTDTPLAPRPTS